MHGLCQALQHTVTSRMTETIVEGLEVIHIQHDQCTGFFRGQQPRQGFGKGAAIGQPGKFIGFRQLLELVIQPNSSRCSPSICKSLRSLTKSSLSAAANWVSMARRDCGHG